MTWLRWCRPMQNRSGDPPSTWYMTHMMVTYALGLKPPGWSSIAPWSFLLRFLEYWSWTVASTPGSRYDALSHRPSYRQSRQCRNGLAGPSSLKTVSCQPVVCDLHPWYPYWFPSVPCSCNKPCVDSSWLLWCLTGVSKLYWGMLSVVVGTLLWILCDQDGLALS